MKNGEIRCPGADILRRRPERHGTQGLEFWVDKVRDKVPGCGELAQTIVEKWDPDVELLGKEL